MKLHENKKLFEDAVLAASQHFRIPEIYIEKDYWVTLALYQIFHSDLKTEAVFKGGTALSKCHKLIERFSEDIDIVVLRREGENDNQMKKKLKSITTIVDTVMPEVQIDGLTNKQGQIRKTVHQYDQVGFKGVFGQVREHIIVEASWLGSHEPFTKEEVSSYITDLMKATGQDQLVNDYNMPPFTVQVLSKERTLCEKIMSLVRFSMQNEDPYTDLSNKIRHVYDIHMMLQNETVKTFFESPEFDKMLITVGRDDITSYKNDNKWLLNHPATALIFAEPEDTWNKIKNTYRTIFKELVTGVLPEEADIQNTLKIVAERLNKIDWKL
jgi:hypothetical protein